MPNQPRVVSDSDTETLRPSVDVSEQRSSLFLSKYLHFLTFFVRISWSRDLTGVVSDAPGDFLSLRRASTTPVRMQVGGRGAIYEPLWLILAFLNPILFCEWAAQPPPGS